MPTNTAPGQKPISGKTEFFQSSYFIEMEGELIVLILSTPISVPKNLST